MKKIKLIKYIFTILGIGILVGTFFIYMNASNFLKTSITSQGTVVDLLESISSSNNSIMYNPLVNFIDEKGNSIEFSSSSGSNPPSYSIGEQVEVLYNPEFPNDAKINGFFSIWGGAIITGILGVVFFSIGISIFIFEKRKRITLQYLKQNGTAIQSDLQRVGINNSLAVNGRSPYQIVSQWQNPVTSKLHIFTSDNIWFDPTDFIKTNKIKVFIDRNNPKKYVTDLSFLPKTV